MKNTVIKLAVALAAVCLAWLAFSPAASASTTVSAAQAAYQQREVDDLLQRVPGGTQVGRGEISWYGGQVTASVPAPGTVQAAAGRICSGASICLYANRNQGGTKVTYRCGTWDVRPWFPPRTYAGVSSWHATTTGLLSNIPVGSPPSTGAGVRVTRGLGNVPGWFNDHATTVRVCY